MIFFEKNRTNMAGNNAEKASNKEKLPKPVYYIESPDDNTVLVGIDTIIEHDKIGDQEVSMISWYDTRHERIMTASETMQKGDFFAFKRIGQEGGGTYYFAPMNLEIYKGKVKDRLTNGGDFTNDDDLIKAFLETLEDEI